MFLIGSDLDMPTVRWGYKAGKVVPIVWYAHAETGLSSGRLLFCQGTFNYHMESFKLIQGKKKNLIQFTILMSKYDG